LSLGAGLGVVFGGWMCLVAKALDAWCRPVSDPRWRLRLSARRVTRERRWIGVVQLALWQRIGAGRWPRDRLLIGDWTAFGSLLGATGGIIAAVAPL
jgi:hypothetical protein